MTEKKDHYIKALEYAESKKYFFLKDLISDLNIDSVHEAQLALQIHGGQIFLHNNVDYINNYKTSNIKLSFSVEDKFRLLNYTALEEARLSSRNATFYAGAALTISIVTLAITCIQLYISK